MGDTDMIKKRSVEIPGWTIEGIKILSSVIIALAIGYVRFARVESRVQDHATTIAKLETKAENSKDTDMQLDQKFNTLSLQQNLVSGEFRDSLKRIEDDIKELKADLKSSNGRKTTP